MLNDNSSLVVNAVAYTSSSKIHWDVLRYRQFLILSLSLSFSLSLLHILQYYYIFIYIYIFILFLFLVLSSNL